MLSFSLVWLLFSLKEVPNFENIAELMPRVQKSTSKGEKLQFILPDGTRVWLNSSSKLEFPKMFDSDERKVILSGEGFFEVEKDSKRPFKVETRGLITTALGTSFNVNSKIENEVIVSLMTGKVKINATLIKNEIFLDPGQELRYHSTNSDSQINRFELKDVVAWREGILIFKDAPLPEVVNLLEDWYGVSIHLENANGVEWKYSGEYKHQTLDNVLSTLSYVQEFDYSINEKSVIIKFLSK